MPQPAESQPLELTGTIVDRLLPVRVRVTGNYEVQVEVGGSPVDQEPGTPNPQCAWPISSVSTRAAGEPVFSLPPYKVETQFITLTESLDWGLGLLRVPEAWKLTQGEGVKVGVCDTGCDYHHADLGGELGNGGEESLAAIVAMQDFTGSRYGAMDRNGHGTHCAGIIAARRNQIGIAGVAPRAQLVIAKVLGDNGSGTGRGVANGIDFCRDQQCKIISMSLGSPQPDHQILAAIERAVAAGVYVVMAAGNDGRDDSVEFPARWRLGLAVAAVDRNGKIAQFSSRGPEVDIAAPGQDVTSTWPGGGYAKLSGTSMATPFVAGQVALLLARNMQPGVVSPVKDMATLKEHLARHATDAGPVGRDPAYGWGLVNADTLLRARSRAADRTSRRWRGDRSAAVGQGHDPHAGRGGGFVLGRPEITTSFHQGLAESQRVYTMAFFLPSPRLRVSVVNLFVGVALLASCGTCEARPPYRPPWKPRPKPVPTPAPVPTPIPDPGPCPVPANRPPLPPEVRGDGSRACGGKPAWASAAVMLGSCIQLKDYPASEVELAWVQIESLDAAGTVLSTKKTLGRDVWGELDTRYPFWGIGGTNKVEAWQPRELRGDSLLIHPYLRADKIWHFWGTKVALAAGTKKIRTSARVKITGGAYFCIGSDWWCIRQQHVEHMGAVQFDRSRDDQYRRPAVALVQPGESRLADDRGSTVRRSRSWTGRESTKAGKAEFQTPNPFSFSHFRVFAMKLESAVDSDKDYKFADLTGGRRGDLNHGGTETRSRRVFYSLRLRASVVHLDPGM